jgi:hypothetical protein
MRRIFTFILGAMAVFAAATSSFAEDRTVPANKTSVISFYYVFLEETCSFGAKPTFKVLSPPEHGTITSRWINVKLKDVRKNCKGRPIYGTAVFYTPNKGYRGKDSARVGFGKVEIPMALPMSSRAMSFDITVQ